MKTKTKIFQYLASLVLMLAFAGFAGTASADQTLLEAFQKSKELNSKPMEKPEWDDGRYRDEEGNPTFYVHKEKMEGRDGKERDYDVWDWATYVGNRTYHAECHVCHGPNALGSSYAPALYESLKTMSYEKFQEVVINGQKNIYRAENSVMPALGTNKNVYCFLDDLYTYLKARASDRLPPVAIAQMKRENKSKEANAYAKECLGY